MSDILDILGCEHPLTIGAMAHIGTPELGIPTVEAGFGCCILASLMILDELERKMDENGAKFSEAGTHSYGLNILMADNPRIKEDVDLVVKMKPRFVTLSAVLRPSPDVFKAFHQAGIYVGVLVGSTRFTNLCLKVLKKEELKPDFFIAEGKSSGGHLGP